MFSIFSPPKAGAFWRRVSEMDITVKDLSPMDEVSIRTRRSEYRFRITDPHLCRGVLSGGMFGEQEFDAVLTGTPLPADLQTQLATRLEIGGSALFYVAMKENVSLLTTSTITDLTLAAKRDPIFMPACC
jgi:hypothetical protein